MSIEFILYDYQSLLEANKSKTYQESIHLQTKVLVYFLYENNLLNNIDCFDNEGEIKPNLIIYSSNVTCEGLELFKKAIPSWFRAHDRDTPIEKITILERGLKKIRENNQ